MKTKTPDPFDRPHWSNDDPLLNDMLAQTQKIAARQAAGRYAMNGAEGMSAQLADVSKLSNLTCDYLGKFCPDGTVIDVIRGVNLYYMVDQIYNH